MFCVGLTGPIGAGKSTVARVLQGLGVAVYDSDSRAKLLIGSQLAGDVRAIFGSEAFDGQAVNRAYIAKRIFGDAQLRQQFESVVHPAVERDFLAWTLLQRRSRYVVVESAILIGSVLEQHIDYLIVVGASEEERIRRVMARDGVGRDVVCSRIAAQMSFAQMQSKANTVIETDQNELLIPKVVAINEKLLTLSSQ